MILSETKICVIGLGYVGLPLARLFSTKFKTIGYDMNESRVNSLMKGHDATLEISDAVLKDALNSGFECTTSIEKIKDYNFYVIAVPTPVDKNNVPDLTPLLSASRKVGSVINKSNVVVYESTVYPGVSENECVPVIEKVSGLKFNKDFFIGYSPERNNPGDKKHTVADILKITSGSTEETANYVDNVYSSIIKAGTYKASSVMVAEASKVIENTQRDINIAFVNELSHIFSLLGIDTEEVIKAASTKWNFIPYTPGLVGGHCIGVDPYYLVQCAEELGYSPSLIKSARKINNGMGGYVAQRTIDLMLKKSINISKSNILVLGFTFKENCGDIRNTKVIDIVNKLSDYHADVDICDPIADASLVKKEYGLNIFKNPPKKRYDAIIIAVAHHHFKSLDINALLKADNVIFDVKGVLGKGNSDACL
ncbi:MAG: nucleotide sugar dehydrogenase [Bacteroidales bacterium]